MKKYLLALALCAFAFAGESAQLHTIRNVQDGEYPIKAGGRLANVELFSPVADGSAALSRVFYAEFFTNAVDTTSEIVTNVNEIKVYDTVFYRGDGVLFTNIFSGVYSNNVNTKCWESTGDVPKAAIWWNNISGWHYSTLWEDDYNQYDWGLQNNFVTFDEDKIDFGSGASIVEFSRSGIYNHSDYSTNVVTVVTTNGVAPVKAYDIVVTNTIKSGSCSGNYWNGTPENDVYLFPGDRLIFSGTATGGNLRLVIQ